MAHTSRPIIAILVAAILAACSSGGVAPLTPQAQTLADNAHRAAKGTLTIRIRIPKEHHDVRGPRYISAATKGMKIAFTGASTFRKVINLTPSDPRCSGSPLTCTIDVSLSAGSYSATINTYDRAPVGGKIPTDAHLLSTAHNIAFSVKRGIANKFSVTLDGVPASFFIGNFPSASAGTGFLSKPFTVTAKDADGYIIVGTYATPITLTDSDSSGATAIATAGSDNPPGDEMLSSSDTATISYTGLAIAPVTIAASAGAAKGSGIFAVHLPVFVADAKNNAVKEIPPGCVADSCVTTLGGGFLFPTGVAVDRSGNVFVADEGDNAVKAIPPGCVTAVCVTTLGSGFSDPEGVAVDGSGNVFVADSSNNAVKEIRLVHLVRVVTTLGGGFLFPEGVAVDGSGNVFVGDTGNEDVKKIPPGCVTADCVIPLVGGFSDPDGVAVDRSGNVFVADTRNNAVYEIPAGCVTAGCLTTLGGGFSEPTGVALDASGNVFVADSSNNAVKEIPSGCLAPGCVTALGGGFENPTGVAILQL